MRIGIDGQCSPRAKPLEVSQITLEYKKAAGYGNGLAAMYYIDYPTWPRMEEHIWVKPCGHLCKYNLTNCCRCDYGEFTCNICAMRKKMRR